MQWADAAAEALHDPAPCLLLPVFPQEAVRDAEAALGERAGLQKRVAELGEALEAEAAGRAKLTDKVARKLAAAEQEVGVGAVRVGPLHA